MPVHKPMPRTFDTALTFTEARLAAPRIGPYGFTSSDVPDSDWLDSERLMFARCVHLIAPLAPRKRPCGDNLPRAYCEANTRGYLPVGVVQLACVALGVPCTPLSDPFAPLEPRRAMVGLSSIQFGLGSQWVLDKSRADEPEADPSFWLGHRLTR